MLREYAGSRRLRPVGRCGTVRIMTGPPRPIATPCIKVCVVDGESGLCMGCWRTLQEVATWARLDETTRSAILAELPSRFDRVRPEKRAMFGRA